MERMKNSMAKGLAAALVAGGLVGCASDPAQTAAEQQQVAEQIDTILTQPLGEEDYGGGERCISTRLYDSVEVLDTRHVLFKGRGERLWVNTLRSNCVGLRKRDVLQFDLRGSQICNLDTFTAVTNTFGWQRTSATCSLGDFSPVTAEQVAMIEAALDTKKKKK
ncbi:MAG: hypothetical protein GWM88_17495 [Pseudomonadales bacterium]|nr:hypothetical protein [Pseudomonadales bacterium]NIX09729.1 hypothetical protein [Pseudomonadales bacterium]